MPNSQKNLDRGGLDTNVQITVPLSVFRKMRKFVEEAEEDARLERKAIIVLLAATAILFFAAIGYFLIIEIEKIYSRPSAQPKPQTALRVAFVGGEETTGTTGAYVKRWVQKVEKNGNENYPTHLRAKNIHGTLLFMATIRSDGTLESLNIMRSSGISELDNAALTIIRNTFPFEPFPSDLRQNTDVIRLARTMVFKSDGNDPVKTP